MLNPFKEVNWHPALAARRTFARSLVIGFPCLAVVLLLAGGLTGKGWSMELPLKLGGIGAAAGVLFYLVPAVAWPFYVLWYGLACCMGLVVGNVVMAVIFYVLVTGIGLLKRLGGSQPIRQRPDPQLKTYWLEAPPPSSPKRYFSQF